MLSLIDCITIEGSNLIHIHNNVIKHHGFHQQLGNYILEKYLNGCRYDISHGQNVPVNHWWIIMCSYEKQSVNKVVCWSLPSVTLPRSKMHSGGQGSNSKVCDNLGEMGFWETLESELKVWKIFLLQKTGWVGCFTYVYVYQFILLVFFIKKNIFCVYLLLRIYWFELK